PVVDVGAPAPLARYVERIGAHPKARRGVVLDQLTDTAGRDSGQFGTWNRIANVDGLLASHLVVTAPVELIRGVCIDRATTGVRFTAVWVTTLACAVAGLLP